MKKQIQWLKAKTTMLVVIGVLFLMPDDVITAGIGIGCFIWAAACNHWADYWQAKLLEITLSNEIYEGSGND